MVALRLAGVDARGPPADDDEAAGEWYRVAGESWLLRESCVDD